jgi:hypothetical protein
MGPRLSTLRTHYDNLKVARDAPLEVIEAAYWKLMQRLRPDQNRGPGAKRALRIVNAAYEVLSDPEKRQKHDMWIRGAEAFEGGTVVRRLGLKLTGLVKHYPATLTWRTQRMYLALKQKRMLVAMISVATALAYSYSEFKVVDVSPQPRMASSVAVPQANLEPVPSNFSASMAPLTGIVGAPVIKPRIRDKPQSTKKFLKCALNEQRWPATSGYLPNGASPPENGESIISIDNSAGNFDAFVKLVVDPEGRKRSVAWIFVKARGYFTTAGLGPGAYALYFQDVASCAASRSPTFQLRQYDTSDAVHYSQYQITLYTRVDGNIHMRSIGQDEFDALDVNPNI